MTASATMSAPVVRRPARPRIPWPWLDRAGRFSPLKLAVLVLSLLPGAVVAWWLATGQMGGEPFKQAAREIGAFTYRFLLLTLLVTPLRVVADWPGIVQVRRMLGLATLAYALAHLGLYAAHMNGDLAKVASEIALRIYLTLGFVALLGLVALGATSTDAAMRRMGRGWKRLHRLVVPIALLGLAHFFIQSKADVTEPTLMAGFLAWLLFWRALPRELQSSRLALVSLAILAALATMAVEYAWYALATSIPAERVLLANLDPAMGLRPAAWVLLVGLVAAAVPWLRRRLGALLSARLGWRPAPPARRSGSPGSAPASAGRAEAAGNPGR